VYIPALQDWPNKGWFIAEDTGGAIKGYKLDIFIPDRGAALRFGRQRLEAHVYKPKD
jgi:3D (Asp-Asp-Asp) domain-containing protein